MIRPIRHDFNTDDNYVGIRMANYVAVALFAVVLVLSGIWCYQRFLRAEKAIQHSISHGSFIARGHYRHLRKYSNGGR